MHQLSAIEVTSSDRYATFNPKYRTLVFSRDYVQARGLDGAFVRFFADGESKLIGWTKCEGSNLLKKDGRVRQIKSYNGGSHSIRLPKATVLSFLGMTPKTKVFKRMAIREYKDALLGQVDYISVSGNKTDESDDAN